MQTKFFERPEGTLAYDDTGGSGELVLMLPGIGDVRAEYRFVVPALAEAGYRVVTADLRGHGESSVDWAEYSAAAVGWDILALIDHLEAGPAHLVGASFSPGAAVWAAAERPEAIRSLVLIGPFVRDLPVGPLQKLAQGVMMSGPWKVWAWDQFYKSLYPTRQPEDFAAYRAALRANLAEPGRFEALKGLGFAHKAEVEARLERVNRPALVVMGSKDPDFHPPEAEARFVAEKLGGQVLMVGGAGHYPHAEMPEQVTPALLSFLQSVRESNDAPART